MALFHRALPREGDWLIILGMAAVVGVSAAVIADFQDFFHDGEFLPGAENFYSFEWLNIAPACC